MPMNSEIIRLDFNNMMEHILGHGNGLRMSDINGLKKKTHEIHGLIQKMRAAGTTPFYDIIFRENGLDQILAIAQSIRERFENLVVLGVGGSALGARALHQAINHPLHNRLPAEKRKGVRLFVADNIDPATFGSLLEHLEPSRTLFNVISRSGETAETLAQFLIARDYLIRTIGGERYKDHFLLTTDSKTGPLRELAEEENYWSVDLADGVVGRYSVFSAVGLIPAAAGGIDVRSFLSGARDMAGRCGVANLWENPAYMNGALHYLSQRKKGKQVCVVMPYSDQLAGVAEWFCQLWAESLGKGKNLRGQKVAGAQYPVRARGITDQHSQLQLYMEGPNNKIFDFIRVESLSSSVSIPRSYDKKEGLGYLGGYALSDLLLAEAKATKMALSKNGRMNSTIMLKSITPHSIGQLLFMFELQTVFAAGLYGVNPFNQPGVEKGKRLTYGLMGRRGYRKEKKEMADWARKQNNRFIL